MKYLHLPLACAALAGCGVQYESPAVSGGAAANGVEIRVLSNRADLISGGDALVEIVTPSGISPAAATVDDDGRDVTSAFTLRSDGRFVGLIDGLDLGPNVLTARLPDGRGARITITNHPIGGPVFSGAQVQPWTCTTADSANDLGEPQDAQCNAAPVVTNQGAVTREKGAINRGIYEISVPAAWNGKLLWQFGASTSQRYNQGTADSTNDPALARGWMVASSSMTNNGQHSNDVTQAETLMMVKEHIIETYGEILFTVGQGGSGGALQQHQIADGYPGLLDGLRPIQDWEDTWSGSAREFGDCAALFRHFQSSPLWTDVNQQVAVFGHGGTGVCNTAAGRAPDYFAADDGTNCAGADSYDAATNPNGTRCTLADFMVSIFGKRSDGKAKRAWDNVGVQYGLVPLQQGVITPEQFADLNANVGGYDIDFNWQPARSAADPDSVEIAHRTGKVTFGREMGKAAIIAIRGTDNNDYHYPWRTKVNQARLSRANGHHDNYVAWTAASQNAVAVTPDPRDDTLGTMDTWLTAIKADTSADPLEVKVVKNKPAAAVDHCYINGVMSTDVAACDAAFPFKSDTRTTAGGPPTSDILKCQLKPLDRASPDYTGITFTDAQWAQLQSAFPTGVCDFSKPGVGQDEPPQAWVTFEDGPGGRALGPAPVSTPLN